MKQQIKFSITEDLDAALESYLWDFIDSLEKTGLTFSETAEIFQSRYKKAYRDIKNFSKNNFIIYDFKTGICKFETEEKSKK